MADVTISQLTRNVPSGNNILPYSTGSNTLGVPVSAIFQNTTSNIGIGLNVTNPFASDVNVSLSKGISLGNGCPVRNSNNQWLLGYNTSKSAVEIGSGAPGDGLILNSNGMNRVRYLSSGEIVHYSNNTGTITKVEKTIMFLNNSVTSFPVLRQFHDANNWGIGNIKIEITSVYYGPGVYQNGVYLARYGYSGNSADIVTKISGGGVVDDKLFWGPATFVANDSFRSFYYRDLSFTVSSYVVYRLDITTPGVYHPLSSPTPSADSYYGTYIYNGNY